MLATPSTLLPANEVGRLQSLHSYGIVDSLREDVFDELVLVLASLFRLPIAYLGLLEADQLSYKATHGFASEPPYPRVNSLCALIIKHNRVVVYHDLATAPQTSLDATAIRHSLARQVRFYAGAPLRMPDHHTIGTLCLAGQQPREFSPAEQLGLEEAAAVVSLAIVVRSQGEQRWLRVRAQACEELYALGALVRYLAARYGDSTPVPGDVMQPVRRRLHDLRAVLQEA